MPLLRFSSLKSLSNSTVRTLSLPVFSPQTSLHHQTLRPIPCLHRLLKLWPVWTVQSLHMIVSHQLFVTVFTHLAILLCTVLLCLTKVALYFRQGYQIYGPVVQNKNKNKINHTHMLNVFFFLIHNKIIRICMQTLF